jgi:Tol biopolymer transport system component
LTEGSDNRGPTFSPDGAWIAFTSIRDGDNEIYAIRPDGTGLTQLTTNTRPDWQPRWGP